MTRRFQTFLISLLVGIPSALGAQAQERTGVLHVIWDVDGADARAWFLVQEDGSALRLEVAPERSDALLPLDRSPVRVTGSLVDAAPRPLLEPMAVEPLARAAAADPATSRDFATLLCRFPDLPDPFDATAVGVVHGATYPGIQQYYRELSRDPTLMAGSRIFGWFTLPKPRAAYVSGTYLDFAGLMQDCIASADAFVDFSRFYGINVQTNGPLSTRPTPPNDILSFGGGWSAIVDGQLRTFGATWLSGIHHSNYVVVTHEIGHALGWPHSSGNYGQEYDSNWDVMSRGYLRFEQPWGALTIHTIAHHKNAAGWIPAARRFVPPDGVASSIFLARSALPPEHGYLMAEVPLGGDRSMTFEARLPAGHDNPLPANAVVVHQTQGPRAWVVDPDLDGDPNDEAASWTPGEMFLDPANRIAMRVDSATDDGFFVTFMRGSNCVIEVSSNTSAGGSAEIVEGGHFGPCTRTVTIRATPDSGWRFVRWLEGNETLSGERELLLVLSAGAPAYRLIRAEFVGVGALRARAVAASMGGAPLPAAEAALLDREGNRNGVYDLGDLRALIDSTW